MPYLEVQKSDVGEDGSACLVEMPNVIGMSVEEAKKTLQDLGLNLEINGEGEVVAEQLPKKGIKINGDSKVIVYTE